MEPEVLETIEASDKASTEESATPAPQSSSASVIEYEELQEDVQASTSAQSERAASPVREMLSSSDESDDDDHHIASTLLRSKAQPAASASKSTPKARRGRSRTRQAATSSRKGKERAEPGAEADGTSLYTGDEQAKADETLTESAEAEEPARGRATTPQKDSTGRNIVTAFIVPGSPIAATTPMEELEVSAMLAPRPSQPRFHRHGTSGSIHVLSPPARKRKLSPSSRSSASRTSAEPVLGSSAAPVHPDAEHPSHQGTLNVSGSPIQTRSQCTYRKLMIPNPYMGSINTPGRRISTRLARAAGGAESNNEEYPASFVFLVPGCVTADRKEQMQEGGIVDLGVASVEEEGSAMALQASEENDLGLHVEGLPDSVVQSLVRVVGLEMFRWVKL